MLFIHLGREEREFRIVLLQNTKKVNFPSPLARIQLSHVTTYVSRHYVTTETALCVLHFFLQRFSPE